MGNEVKERTADACRQQNRLSNMIIVKIVYLLIVIDNHLHLQEMPYLVYTMLK